ncbi:MAG TPA: hypothetical protein DEQ47_07235 [Solibacterales bacterium]|nr:hypothetical protein [Bryobacterales bacterium]
MGPGLLAQTADPAYAPLEQAYAALRVKDYDRAIPLFEQAVAVAPERAAIRKDLAYTLLKTGESEAARDQFAVAVRLAPGDEHTALEYAFLCFEAPDREEARAIPFKAEARRIFDRLRHSADPAARATAGQAFSNIDAPLAAGIARWSEAVLRSPSFSAHFELAQLAEQRDDLPLAAENYLAAWKLLPERRGVLIDLGRVYQSRGLPAQAHAAWLAASRGGEPRAAEMARRLLPARYPFVYEFRRALLLDPANAALHRELAYLLMRMAETGEVSHADAEREFRDITTQDPADVQAAAQLGLLYWGRDEKELARPLLDRVLQGADDDLANRVRTAMHLPVKLVSRSAVPTEASPRLMADRSLRAGYLKDALRYLRLAHEADPGDYSVIYKLGTVLNQLQDDAEAIQWFAVARGSPDAEIAANATRAWHNLRPSLALLRTTTWVFPFYSSRWHDVFAYGQVKTEFRLGKLPFRPYLSMRFVGDSRQTLPGGVEPQYLSESSIIVGAGVATRQWHGLMGWAEAGSSIGYLDHHARPDYRGGASWARFYGRNIYSSERGLFLENNADSVFIGRFNNDLINYGQLHAGYTPATPRIATQVVWNAGLTFDARRQYWANFIETGPGVRVHVNGTPRPLVFSANFLRGAYLINRGNPRGPNFNDVRIGLWYAFTH